MTGYALLLLPLLGVSPASAQAPSDEVAKLKARIDKLEAENAAIKKELAELKARLTDKKAGKKPLEVKPPTAEDDIKKAVQVFFLDVHQGRNGSAYHCMSAAYQKRTERKAFDAFIDKHAFLKRAHVFHASFDGAADYKFRKLAKDQGYECDFLGIGVFDGPIMNITLRVVEQEGEWKIDDFVELRGPKR